jgi:general secretion pathway protein G
MRRKSINAGSNAGFTLVEVLLVVAILGILATVVVVNVAGKADASRKTATRTSIAGIQSAIQLYEMNTAKYPQSLQNLLTSGGEPNWSGPYLQGGSAALADSWGNVFAYSYKGSGLFEVRSAGPDGQMNTGDDLLNSASQDK